MTVPAEIHVPGLDMYPTRWSYHLMFMEEVHVKIREIAAVASEGYKAHGRGSVYVTKQQWVSVVKQAVEKSAETFPCSFVGRADMKKVDFGICSKSVDDLIGQYDTELHLVLTVEHYPGGSLSVYCISPE